MWFAGAVSPKVLRNQKVQLTPLRKSADERIELSPDDLSDGFCDRDGPVVYLCRPKGFVMFLTRLSGTHIHLS